MPTKPNIAKGTRAKLLVDVPYRDMRDHHTALAGSVVVVDSTGGTGVSAAVSQTVVGRPKETHRFYVRLEKLEAIG